MPSNLTLPGGRVVPLNYDDTSAGIPTNLTGQTPGGYDPAYGGVPAIPNPTASMWSALGGDVNSLGTIFGLGNATNLFNYDQRQQQVSGTPGYSNVLGLLHGQLPPDVMAQLNQGAAERGTNLGLDPNSPNVNAAYLRGLGLSSIDAQKLGQQEYGALNNLFPQAAPFDVNKFFMSPEDYQSANLAANQAAAAPNPRAAADAEFQKLLQAIAAGKSNQVGGIIGGGAPGPSGLLNGLGGLSGPAAVNEPGEVVGAGPNTTLNPTPGTLSFNDWLNKTFPGGYTGGLGTGTPSSTAPGPATGTSAYNAGNTSLLNSILAGGGAGAGGTNWWASGNPWDALSNQDWGAGLNLGTGAGATGPAPTSNWWEQSDPLAALGAGQTSSTLPGTDWWDDPGNYFAQLPGEEGWTGTGEWDNPADYALPFEDYYGG